MKYIALMILPLVVLVAGCTTILPLAATSNLVNSQMGKACSKNILGFIPLEGDPSIYTAAKNGGITKISTVDREIFISLVYNTNCTIVRGSKGGDKPMQTTTP